MTGGMDTAAGTQVGGPAASARSGGVPRGAFPWWVAGRVTGEKALVVVPADDVERAAEAMEALSRLPPAFSPPPPVSIVPYTEEDEAGRQVSLVAWLDGEARVLVTSREALGLPCDDLPGLRGRTLRLRLGTTIGRKTLEDVLGAGGYVRNDRADQPGEYSIRGDVIDVWPAGAATPVRITWEFDTVESLREINLHTQRSETFCREVTLCPVTAGAAATLETLIPASAEVFVFDPGVDAFVFPDAFRGRDVCVAGPGGRVASEGLGGLEPAPVFHGNVGLLREHLARWHDEDWTVAVFCHNQGERDRLEELLADPVIAAGGRVPWMPRFVIGEVEHGFLDAARRFAVLANSEIFGRYRKRVRLPKFRTRAALSSPLDIRPGDFVVHERFGIGRYLGLRPLTVSNIASEFLSIEYKGGDRIYVPIFEIQQVQKYLGAEGRRPALSSLDAETWERVKGRVKEDVARLAAELLKNAARRKVRPGYAFPPATHLEQEFAASFLYQLTPDQERTLGEVERDMTAARAMDRLICGDVGYGKTEVAMRAAFKCALAARQGVFLCPTTILAEQHFRNFTERLADYPVTVRLLSRFQDRAEQRMVLEALATGGVDIVIGTHRLLSSDVSFKNLGLIVIDEEHRFGVKQKHQLTALRSTVDVLSMTATPIPRTLAASLGGIKDLSIIETPPQGRLPIATHAGVFEEDVMAKAVQTELDRGGQVFYVHNRVKTLLARRQYLESLMPQIRIAMAHGQMREAELEKAMHAFLHRKVDVLLATTIIESGLDIPSVNTIIVEEAEEMGLAQLYQIRGRVGRSAQKAYCYLFYGGGGLTVEAKKRLEALKEFSSLGSGFRLAMRDMEIRGAGNLLGPQQHGNMAAVGVETYSRMLSEEISRQDGAPPEELDQRGPLLEVAISAHLPEDYLPVEAERVQMYKRILSADAPGLEKIREELVDRCGALPAPAKTLIDAAHLRLIARGHGVHEVHQEDGALLILFRPGFTLPEAAFEILLAGNGSRWTLVPGAANGVRIPCSDGTDPLDALGQFLRCVFGSAGA